MRARLHKPDLMITTVAAVLFAAGGAWAACGGSAGDASHSQAMGPQAAPAFTVHLAASDTPAELSQSADKSEYQQDVGSKIDQWKQKVSEFTSEAKAEGEAAGEEAAQQVSSAWATVQEKWSQLQSASAEQWDESKAAFEDAWQDFRDAWQDATRET